MSDGEKQQPIPEEAFQRGNEDGSADLQAVDEALEERREKRWRSKVIFRLATVWVYLGSICFYILLSYAVFNGISHPLLAVCLSLSGLMPASILGMLMFYNSPSKKEDRPHEINPVNAVLKVIIDKCSELTASK